MGTSANLMLTWIRIAIFITCIYATIDKAQAEVMKGVNPLRLSKRGSLSENPDPATFLFNDTGEMRSKKGIFRLSKKGIPRLFRGSPSSNIRLRLSKRSMEGTRSQLEPMVIRLSNLQLGQILFNKRDHDFRSDLTLRL